MKIFIESPLIPPFHLLCDELYASTLGRIKECGVIVKQGAGSCKSLRLTGGGGARRGRAGGKKKPGDNCGGPAPTPQLHNNEVPAKSKAINSTI